MVCEGLFVAESGHAFGSAYMSSMPDACCTASRNLSPSRGLDD